MKYELQKLMFIGGSLRQKGEVVEYDGDLPSHQAIPLDQPKKSKAKAAPDADAEALA